MIIQCKNCKTEFSLDESKVKEGGSKVGCSICKQIFVVYPPSQTPADDGIPALETKPGLSDPDSMNGTVQADLEGASGRHGLLDGLDGLDDILGKPDPGTDEERLFFDEVEKNRMKRPTKGEQDLQQPVAENSKPVRNGPREDEPEIPVMERKEKKSSKGMLFFLIVFFLIIGAAAAFFYLKPKLIPEYLSFLQPEKKQEQIDPGVRLLIFSSVNGGFVETENGDRFFVIKGVVTSKYPEPRSFIEVKGSVLDDQGKVVQARTSYAGNSFTEEELKTLPFSEINKAMQNRDGMARKNFNVQSGTAIPFMIVFENLEGSLSEFTVEAVSSSPGT